MATLRITDSADSLRANVTIADYSIKREGFNIIPEAEIFLNRDAFNQVSGIQPGEDRAYIEIDGNTIFGGILRAPERQGGMVMLLVRGMAQYMDRAPPIQTGQQKVAADDSTLIEECIDATPELSRGTIETVEAGQTWVFGGISPWEKAVKVANSAGAELQVTADREVHYVQRRGLDKTATTLSPARASFVEDTFVVTRDGVTGNATHLHVTGVGQGTAQIEVAVVPDNDTTNYDQYDRVISYENDAWYDGDPAIWATRSNKELKNSDAAASWARKQMHELQEAEVRVEGRVKSDYVGLGDYFHVKHLDEGVDENLRAVEVTEVDGPAAGRRFEVVFSNYNVAHQSPSREKTRNAKRYGGSAFEGDLTNVQQGPGRGPVDNGHDYVLSVFYPGDVVAEVNAQLNISGLNYRAYSKGAANNSDYDSNVQSTSATKSWTTPDSSSWVTVDSITPSSPTSELWCFLQFSVDPNQTDDTVEPDFRLHNATKGTQHPTNIGHPVRALYNDSTNTYTLSSWSIVDPSNTNGDTLYLECQGDRTASVDYGGRVLWFGIGQHVHDPDPGIIDWDGVEQTPEYYPQNVDIVINGQSLGYSFGTGSDEFQETVDVRGHMNPGWNEIRLTSDSLGHLDATYSADLFRQSL